MVKGYVQIPGVVFTDSFEPVAKDSAMQTIFAITLYYGGHKNKPAECWIYEVIDVEAAFLEADMDENIFIEWPEGVEEFGYVTEQELQTSCILLDKAMYFTVQAALQGFKKLVQCLAAEYGNDPE